MNELSTQKITLKSLYLSISQKEFQSVLQPIYKLYFISLQRYELHRKKHLKFAQKCLNDKKQQPKQIPQINFATLGDDDGVDLEYIKDDDECSVIEEGDLVEDLFTKAKNTYPCGSEVNKHDLNEEMNPIAYLVYLELVNESDSLKTQLISDYKNSLKKGVSPINEVFKKLQQGQNQQRQQKQKQTGKQLQIDEASAHNPQVQRESYNQLYSIQTVVIRLQNQFFDFTTNHSSPIFVEVKYYILKIIIYLLKILKQCRFESQAKKQLISCVFTFVNKEFQSILSTNYRFEQGTQEMQQDSLMAAKVQALILLLQGLIGIHFTQERTNLYNLQFLVMFPLEQLQSTKKLQPIKPNQKTEILQIFNSTQRISHTFSTVLQFILNFPEIHLQNGFYPLIQTQLITLIRQIYFEFSQFITIYLFGLATDNWTQGIVDLLNMHKVLIQEENTMFQKYAVVVTPQNLQCVVWAHTILLKYIQKVLDLSFHSDNREWLQIRNKEMLPFMKQIVLFFKRLSNQEETLKSAFEMDFVDSQISGCYFPSVVKRFYDTIFSFLRYFLGRFQNLSISFITEHLSFIECVFEMVQIGRSIRVMEVNRFIEREIDVLNEIKLFKYAPGLGSKKPSRKSFANLSQSPCKQYKGWQYVERLAITDQTIILQELQAYELRFKYYINCEPEYSQTVTAKENSYRKSSVKEGSLQISGKKSKQIMESIKKNSPIYNAEENWMDIEDVDPYEPYDKDLQIIDKINNTKKKTGLIDRLNTNNDVEIDRVPNQNLRDYHQTEKEPYEDLLMNLGGSHYDLDPTNYDIDLQREATGRQRVNSMNQENSITGTDSIIVNLDSVDDVERLNNIEQLEQLIDLNDQDFQNSNSSSFSPDKHLSYHDQDNFNYQINNNKNFQQYHQQQTEFNNQRISESVHHQVKGQDWMNKPNNNSKPRVIEDDELTTYDILESKDYMISPIKDIYDGLDTINQESQRNGQQISQGYSRKGNYSESDSMLENSNSDAYEKQSLSKKQFRTQSQPITFQMLSSYLQADNQTWDTCNLTQPLTHHHQSNQHSQMHFIEHTNSRSNPIHQENSQQDNALKNYSGEKGNPQKNSSNSNKNQSNHSSHSRQTNHHPDKL